MTEGNTERPPQVIDYARPVNDGRPGPWARMASLVQCALSAFGALIATVITVAQISQSYPLRWVVAVVPGSIAFILLWYSVAYLWRALR